MKKAIIFATYIPTPDKIYIGMEFLDYFKRDFPMITERYCLQVTNKLN